MLATLTAVPLDLSTNPGDGMELCKCIVPSQDEGTLNSHQAASPLVRLLEGEKEWEAPDRVFCPIIRVETRQNVLSPASR
ncbi:hypothetical protein TNCV_4602831 [Trichonephila clavipes]|nr:hypothetical protein TNCV_4602831 [Trichonephila clavipes]